MKDATLRLGWAVLVLAAGAALAHGLWLTTYFELTPQAQADAERGHLWLLVGTAVLVVAAVVAGRRWRAPVWSLVALAVAGPLGLVVVRLGWIPLVALLAIGPLLLTGLAGVLSAPRRGSHATAAP